MKKSKRFLVGKKKDTKITITVELDSKKINDERIVFLLSTLADKLMDDINE